MVLRCRRSDLTGLSASLLARKAAQRGRGTGWKQVQLWVVVVRDPMRREQREGERKARDPRRRRIEIGTYTHVARGRTLCTFRDHKAGHREEVERGERRGARPPARVERRG